MEIREVAVVDLIVGDKNLVLTFARKIRFDSMNTAPGSLSFDNTENAFEYKSDKELKKAAFLFSSMGYSSLVKMGTRLTPWMIRSGLPVKGMILDTIFSPFVGAEKLPQTASLT